MCYTLSVNLDIVKKIIKSEPNYRWQQIKKFLFSDLITDWQEAISLPKKLRDDLTRFAPLDLKAEKTVSVDGQTIKSLIKLSDDLAIEAVLMRYPKRNTVCVSSQVGCGLGCKFCFTGSLGFKRDLTYWEIIDQVLYFDRLLQAEGQSVTNVVFMGMGEPFLNYDNVIKAIHLFNDQDTFNIGARRISVSTAGIIEGIKKFSQETIQANLALSLHAPNNQLRNQLMPINKKYPLEQALAVTDEYIKTTNRQVMIEYVMIKGINDQPQQARQLVELFKNRQLYMINLIKYNPTGEFKASSNETIHNFKQILEEACPPNRRGGLEVTERFRFGQSISAGCGQLAGKTKTA